MLLTLAASSLRPLLPEHSANCDVESPIATVKDIPRFARETLGLHGVNVPAWMLKGWKASDLEELREIADKAACPCLLLVDDEILNLGAASAATRSASEDRFSRLAAAAHRLGCNGVAIGCKGGNDEAFERTITSIKSALTTIDRHELNVLLRPTPGLGDDPARLTDLIKRVGGFRIGSLPDFGQAGRSGDPIQTLRKLAPYAGGIHATIEGFAADGSHLGPDLAECIEAIRSVGYQSTVAIEYAGSGDCVKDILRARDILANAIKGESDLDDALVAELLGAEEGIDDAEGSEEAES
ncbi:MAG TPA: TIM barrel protein [Phycisphaerales bacterium]|nr:TIM barrel protein [Phycisphaerales bacterium]HMP38227.1 TIM barrel protein [Phycisphaerales bacterium]